MELRRPNWTYVTVYRRERSLEMLKEHALNVGIAAGVVGSIFVMVGLVWGAVELIARWPWVSIPALIIVGVTAYLVIVWLMAVEAEDRHRDRRVLENARN